MENPKKQREDEFLQILNSTNQKEFLNYFLKCDEVTQVELFEQFKKIDISNFLEMQKAFDRLPEHHSHLKPYKSFEKSGSTYRIKKGEQILRENKGTAILIAGGQGTRLNHKGPKGTFKICPETSASLFELICQKVLEASRRFKTPLMLAIMTSSINDEETQKFFRDNNNFGLEPSQLHFFIQSDAPILDFNCKLMLKDKGKLLVGPNGNGDVYSSFCRSNAFKAFTDAKIEYINLIQIDNPLADPFDCELFGYMADENAEVIIKTSQRSDSNEKVGIIQLENDKPLVVEYTEVAKDKVFKTEPLAYLGMLGFKASFFYQMAEKNLPYHLAKKKNKYFDKDSHQIIEPQEVNSYKFEKFIFDVLYFSKKTSTLVYPRDEIFAPLKNAEGEDSIEEVRKSLQQFKNKKRKN